MTFGQLIIKNMKEQPRTYLTYFLGSVFSVTLFFVASLLYFHPALKEVQTDGNTRWTILTLYLPANNLYGISLLVIAVFALLFLVSMFRQFLKERRANFSLYLVLGMTKAKLWLMLFWENLIIAISSIIAGIGLGLVFSKLFLLLGQNIIQLEFALEFYWPWESVLLTTVIYLLIFLAISISNVFSLTHFHTDVSLNLAHKAFQEPKINQYLVFFSPVMILFGYVGIFYLAKFSQIESVTNILPTSVKVNLGWVLLWVLIFSFGLYWFYDQSLIQLVIYFKGKPKITGSHYLLALSNLVYRLKSSSLLLFLTTYASLGALLVISTTLVLAEIELYGSEEANNLAYTYRAYEIKDESDLRFHQKNIQYMVSTIEKAGYEVRLSEVDDSLSVGLTSEQYLPNFYDNALQMLDENNQPISNQKIIFLLPLSEYNQMAEFKKETPLSLANNRELILLMEGYSSNERSYKGKIEYYSGKATNQLPVTFKFSEARYNAGLNFRHVAVVSDELYQSISLQNSWTTEGTNLDFNEEDISLDQENVIDLPFQVIHFREWAEAQSVDKKIRAYLLARQEELYQDYVAKTSDEETSIDESTFFDYSSAYQTLGVERQEKGTTVLVSLLIGSVFLIFTTCIIYFRLFGELNQDSHYHHILHLIGLTEKERGQVVTMEMFITFFLPLIVSTLLYLGVVLVIRLVYGYRIWGVTFSLVSLFMLFQTILFIILRRAYLRKINWRIKKYQQN